ncbi:hypothetical protein [Novosphingobium sp.]|uniref:hypothetical protein n=1 Tax=Novosphingobium sp. TaxID=1874826 RepID=UPI003D0F8AEF
MLPSTHHTLDPDLYPAGTQIESTGSAVSWAAILAGGTTAIAVWLVLFTLGAGLGLSASASMADTQSNVTTFRIAAGIWLIITQWISFALGGYIAGRLRVRWASLHTDEVFFRDTAHGLLTWAIATVIVGGLAAVATVFSSPGAMPVAEMPDATVEAMRKAAAATAIFTSVAMVTGAFIASVSAVIGGRLRDRHP